MAGQFGLTIFECQPVKLKEDSKFNTLAGKKESVSLTAELLTKTAKIM